MSEFKGTPGPWHAEPEDKGDSSVGLNGYPAHVWAWSDGEDSETVEICRISPACYRVTPEPGDEYDEGIKQVGDPEANARLIAAAPDLLEACRRALGWITEDVVERDILEAAIAKATGTDS